jgi:hypothetical protein
LPGPDAVLANSVLASVSGVLHSTAFLVARNAVVFFALVFWLALAFWVFRDARRRIGPASLVATATLLGLVAPYIGPVIYLLFRPPETLTDVRARELEVRALEERLLRPTPHCAVCHAEIEPTFLVCPVCATQLKRPCVRCEAALEQLWQACPYCATPVGATVASLEPPAADLDAALTAEVAATTNGKARAPAARSRKARPAAS